jgi:hypothetical protein
MLILLSPAKSLDFETPVAGAPRTLPQFAADARRLVTLLRRQTPADLSALMSISPQLAALNHERYRQWSPKFPPERSRSALFAFAGDVYTGLDARTCDPAGIEWASAHVRILSGLYGLLRPLDAIQPYRLEMGTRLPNPRGADLYAFWGSRLTDAVNGLLAADPAPLLVNLASQEYFGAIQPGDVNAAIVTPTFRELRGGKYRFISFAAKKARGAMTRHLIDARATDADAIRAFDRDGYRFDEALSNDHEWVFTRPAA